VNNAYILLVFFGLLGLVCLVMPKLIFTFYVEITKLRSGSRLENMEKVASSAQLNMIRLVGVGILVLLGLVYFY